MEIKKMLIQEMEFHTLWLEPVRLDSMQLPV